MKNPLLKLAMYSALAVNIGAYSITPLMAQEYGDATPSEGPEKPSHSSANRASPFVIGLTTGSNGKASPLAGTSKVPFRATSNSTTKLIVEGIRSLNSFCASTADASYIVDCLGAGLADLAKTIPKSGEYAEAQAIIQNASGKLRKLATQNVSPSKPKARLSGKINTVKVRTQRLTPIKATAVKSTAVQAAAIMVEAETLLLRSVGNSDRRKVHYAQMAKAMGSNKVLLRSL
jgi:hypothetical protein